MVIRYNAPQVNILYYTQGVFSYDFHQIRSLSPFHEPRIYCMHLKMATFVTLVTEICSVRIVDSKNVFDLKLKALGLFESNGFNIESVCSRLLKLIEVHNVQSQLEGEKRSLKAKVLQVEEEMEKKYELLLAVDEDLLIRERELRRIQDKREFMILEIERMNMKMVIWKRVSKQLKKTLTLLNSSSMLY
ncbi:uncharacterized protein LOC109839774 [Asparagus officinalis]|uniref:uncharacterized protein LOC109839774 n=1 Tax=Asparagus officinalis TaxID=4686 RepID=UPI00098DF756|nr:uncharacterized protein LOC109839774 [Asparagus officinalis]